MLMLLEASKMGIYFFIHSCHSSFLYLFQIKYRVYQQQKVNQIEHDFIVFPQIKIE